MANNGTNADELNKLIARDGLQIPLDQESYRTRLDFMVNFDLAYEKVLKNYSDLSETDIIKILVCYIVEYRNTIDELTKPIIKIIQ